ncbi:MAG TPA: hypothetical protein VID76_03670 [Solirubrobacterales bacterium]
MTERPVAHGRLFTVGLVIAVVAGVAISLAMTLFQVIHCTDGDGGAPYVAGDSPQADVCGASGDGLLLLPLALILVAGAALLARRAFAKPAGDGGRTVAVVAALLLAPALPLLALLLINAPADVCSDEQLAANDAAAPGEAPYSCDHY